jgi:hypothetical protein
MKDVIVLKEGLDLELLKREVDSIIQSETYHDKTQMNSVGWKAIGLRTCTGQNSSNVLLPLFSDGQKFQNTEAFNKHCPYTNSILSELERDGSLIYLVRLLKLEAGGVVNEHRDGASFKNPKNAIRCHLPVYTTKDVIMTIDGHKYHLEEGKLYVTRVDKMHSVVNPSSHDRIHFVIDVKPGPKLLHLLTSEASSS